jgi:hypothetical protein
MKHVVGNAPAPLLAPNFPYSPDSDAATSDYVEFDSRHNEGPEAASPAPTPHRLSHISIANQAASFGVPSMPYPSRKRGRDSEPSDDISWKRVCYGSGFPTAKQAIALPQQDKCDTSFGELLLNRDGKRTDGCSEQTSQYFSSPLPPYPPVRKNKRAATFDTEHWPRKRSRVTKVEEADQSSDITMEDIIGDISSINLRPKKRHPRASSVSKSSGVASDTDSESFTLPPSPLFSGTPRSPGSASSTPALSRSSSISSLSDVSYLDAKEMEYLLTGLVDAPTEELHKHSNSYPPSILLTLDSSLI